MLFPGRKKPFEVYFGSPGEIPPLYVSNIVAGHIILRGGVAHQAWDEHSGELYFVDKSNRWENEELFLKLTEFNERRLPFSAQPKEMASPDALMAWWQEIGRLAASFRWISWNGPGKWSITTINPPEIGVLGWTGPKPFGA